MLIRSAPSACMIAARIPGRSATRTCTRKSSAVSSNASRSRSCRFVADSPIQRARKPASPRSSAVSSCSTRRRCSASAVRSSSAFSRKMSTQMRGFAPATRVISRNDAPAAASGSCPSIGAAPTWFSSRFASACGRWLTSASSRSCASGSIATGTAPSEPTNACSVAVAVAVGRRVRREEPRRALEEVRPRALRAAHLGAGDGMAADEALVRDGAGEHALRRADVGHRRARRRGERGLDGGRQHRHLHGDDDELCGGRRLVGRVRRIDALRGRPPSRAPSAFVSQPRTSCPARRAARPTDAPISPVPMTATRIWAVCSTREPAPAVQGRRSPRARARASPRAARRSRAPRRAAAPPLRSRPCSASSSACSSSRHREPERHLELAEPRGRGLEAGLVARQLRRGSGARARRAAAAARPAEATRSWRAAPRPCPVSPHSNAASSASTTPSFMRQERDPELVASRGPAPAPRAPRAACLRPAEPCASWTSIALQDLDVVRRRAASATRRGAPSPRRGSPRQQSIAIEMRGQVRRSRCRRRRRPRSPPRARTLRPSVRAGRAR